MFHYPNGFTAGNGAQYSIGWSTDGGALWTIHGEPVAEPGELLSLPGLPGVAAAGPSNMFAVPGPQGGGGSSSTGDLRLRTYGGPAVCDGGTANEAKAALTNVPNGLQVKNVSVDVSGPLEKGYKGPLTDPALNMWTYVYFASGRGTIDWAVPFVVNGGSPQTISNSFKVTCR
jgi:hypothetical protein